jgi:hypothetical protein
MTNANSSKDVAKQDQLEKKRNEAEKAKPHHDDLDEALADTFPASDPPSPVVHGTASNPQPHEKQRDRK